jgi:hypothetical protein
VGLATLHDAVRELTNRTKLMESFVNPLAELSGGAAGLLSERSDLMSDGLAKGFHRRLVEWIAEFESSLDADHEVALRLVSFGQTMQFHLTDLSWWNPSLIRFDGVTERGDPVQLIQHVSQISVLLMKRPKLGATPRRIGFHAEDPEGSVEASPS